MAIDESDVQTVIESLEGHTALNDWEKGFIASVAKGLKQYGSLTPKQLSVLDRIAKKAQESEDRHA